jgi:hypothetical protein
MWVDVKASGNLWVRKTTKLEANNHGVKEQNW